VSGCSGLYQKHHAGAPVLVGREHVAEYEKHTIIKATVLYIPRGMEHNPLDIKRLGKPMMFSALQLGPYFNGVYQTGLEARLQSSNTFTVSERISAGL